LKLKLYIIFCLFIFFSGLLALSSAEGSGANLIRVAIKTSSNLEIQVKEGVRIIDNTNNRSFATKVPIQLNIKISNPGISINSREFGSNVKIKPAENSLIKIDKKGYRGSIEILRDDKVGLLVINELDVEEYLKGVLNEEISAKWHPEAIKAQAVVARTYALYQKENRKDNPYHMEATTTDQVYGGARREDERTNKAAKDTQGIVLTYEGKLAKVFYHSISGGITEDVTDVWGGEGNNYLKSKKCDFDKDAPNYQWETEIDAVDLEMLLSRNGIKVDGILSIEPVSFTSSRRVSELQRENQRS